MDKRTINLRQHRHQHQRQRLQYQQGQQQLRVLRQGLKEPLLEQRAIQEQQQPQAQPGEPQQARQLSYLRQIPERARPFVQQQALPVGVPLQQEVKKRASRPSSQQEAQKKGYQPF